MMPRSRTPKVKEFVRPPFIRCPDCGEEKFGVLMTSERQYVRRCINCWFDKSFPLPPIRKRLIYLDQFVISNVMKELDPAAPASVKGVKDGFYRTVFEKLDRLNKLHLIVCPHSPVQDHESVVDTRYEKCRTVFRQLSHGVSFKPPETIFHAQIVHAFRAWHHRVPVDPVLRNFVLNGNPDAWLDRFQINLNYTVPGLAQELRARSEVQTTRLREVCQHWRDTPHLSFGDVMAAELNAIVRAPVVEQTRYALRMAAVRRGEIAPDAAELLPPPSARLIAHLLAECEAQIPNLEARMDRLREFFASDAIREVPYARINALFWATLARDINSGRNPDKFPGGGMLNDIDVVSAYAPFCDAMFVDREISHLASQGELRGARTGTARLFSFRANESEQFFAFLDEIEAGASPEHLKLVTDVYGANWGQPFWELLEPRV